MQYPSQLEKCRIYVYLMILFLQGRRTQASPI